jgi:two-component system NarL family response regulator
VDDNEPWRQHIRSILKARLELQVVGEASDGFVAVQSAEELKPDLILLDIGLPSLNGIEVANRLSHLLPAPRILFLSANHDADVVRVALNDRARGYVLKADAGSELLPAIEAILRGQKYVSTGVKGGRL